LRKDWPVNLGISFGRVGHDPVAMKANLLVVIPFEKWGGQQFSEFPHRANLATNKVKLAARQLISSPIAPSFFRGMTVRSRGIAASVRAFW